MLVQKGSTPDHITFTDMVKEAHQHKLQVHPFTTRADRLPAYAKDIDRLYDILYYQADVDGLFTDFPDKAVDFLKKPR